MTDRTIFAYTRPVPNPPYINVAVQPEDRTVRVILRGDDGKTSVEAHFMLEEWQAFLADQEPIRA